MAFRRQTSQTSNIEKLLSFNPALHDKISSEADERAIIKDGIKSYVHSARAEKNSISVHFSPKFEKVSDSSIKNSFKCCSDEKDPFCAFSNYINIFSLFRSFERRFG